MLDDNHERLSCPHCKAEHKTVWSRMPFKEPVTLKCKRCGAILFSGKSTRNYHSIDLIDK